MSMVPTAIGHRILVKPKTMTEIDPVMASAHRAGIQFLDQSDRARQATIDQGYVLEIGPEAFKAFGESKWCRVGDLIAYPKNAGKFVKLSEDPQDLYLVINDEDVVTVLKETNG